MACLPACLPDRPPQAAVLLGAVQRHSQASIWEQRISRIPAPREVWLGGGERRERWGCSRFEQCHVLCAWTDIEDAECVLMTFLYGVWPSGACRWLGE